VFYKRFDGHNKTALLYPTEQLVEQH